MLPFTHGLEAIHQAADGAGLGQVGWLIGTEGLVGIVYAVLAFASSRTSSDPRGPTPPWTSASPST